MNKVMSAQDVIDKRRKLKQARLDARVNKGERVLAPGDLLLTDDDGHFIERRCMRPRCDVALTYASGRFVCLDHWNRLPNSLKQLRGTIRIITVRDYYAQQT